MYLSLIGIGRNIPLFSQDGSNFSVFGLICCSFFFFFTFNLFIYLDFFNKYTLYCFYVPGYNGKDIIFNNTVEVRSYHSSNHFNLSSHICTYCTQCLAALMLHCVVAKKKAS